MEKQNVVYTYNGILLCHIKRMAILTHATWMNLEDIYAKRNKLDPKRPTVWFCFYEVFGGAKFIETDSCVVTSRGGVEGGTVELVFNRGRVLVLQDENSSVYMDGGGCQTVWMHLMPTNCTLKNG